jgi:tripartite-type tricarboxylate transporter receptor subunit TctC
METAMKRCLSLVLLCLSPLVAWAAYPEKPITVVVGFAAGSAIDTAARLTAQKLAGRLGQQVVVDNRAGAGSTIGTAAVARAAPDGYTLLFGSAAGLSVGPALYKNLGYDGVRSFAPVIQMLGGAFVLSTRSGLPVSDLKGLIAYAKQHPGKLSYGSSGVGTLHHLCVEMLKSATGLDIVHIPYKGSSASWLALMSGETDMICDAVPAAMSSVQAGKAKAIAVTGDRRVAVLPQVGTFKEQGFAEIGIEFWFGFLAPAGTPPAIVSQLNSAIAEVLKDPEIISRYQKEGYEVMRGPPEDLGRLIAREADAYAKVIDKAGVKLD